MLSLYLMDRYLVPLFHYTIDISHLKIVFLLHDCYIPHLDIDLLLHDMYYTRQLRFWIVLCL